MRWEAAWKRMKLEEKISLYIVKILNNKLVKWPLIKWVKQIEMGFACLTRIATFFFNPCQLKSNSNLLNFNPNPTNFMRVVSVFYLLVVLKIATTRIIDCVMLMVIGEKNWLEHCYFTPTLAQIMYYPDDYY